MTQSDVQDSHTSVIDPSVLAATDEVRAITAALVGLPDGQSLSPDLLARLRSVAAELSDMDSTGGKFNNPESYMERSPVTGGANAFAPPLHLPLEDVGSTVARFSVGLPYQGPPGRVHGGFVATFLDHVMGVAASKVAQSEGAYTRSLTIDYAEATPLYTELEVGAEVERVDGRKLWLRGWINADGRRRVTATGLWVEARRYRE